MSSDLFTRLNTPRTAILAGSQVGNRAITDAEMSRNVAGFEQSTEKTPLPTTAQQPIEESISSMPLARSKIRKDPRLDRLVSEMLFAKRSYRDIAKTIQEQFGLKVSREAVRHYHKTVYALRLRKASQAEKEVWEVMTKSDAAIELSIFNDRIALLYEQAKNVEALKKKIEEALISRKAPLNARALSTLTKATASLLKIQDDMWNRYEEVRGEEERVRELKERMLEKISPIISGMNNASEDEKAIRIRMIEVAIRDVR